MRAPTGRRLIGLALGLAPAALVVAAVAQHGTALLAVAPLLVLGVALAFGYPGEDRLLALAERRVRRRRPRATRKLLLPRAPSRVVAASVVLARTHGSRGPPARVPAPA